MTEHHASWMAEHTNMRKKIQTKNKTTATATRNNDTRQTLHSSTALRHTGHHRSYAQPNYYNRTRGWQALNRGLPALTSPVRCCCFDFFSHTKQGAPKQKGVMFFSRCLSKSTHRSSSICPLMNKPSSCGGKRPSLIPIV